MECVSASTAEMYPILHRIVRESALPFRLLVLSPSRYHHWLQIFAPSTENRRRLITFRCGATHRKKKCRHVRCNGIFSRILLVSVTLAVTYCCEAPALTNVTKRGKQKSISSLRTSSSLGTHPAYSSVDDNQEVVACGFGPTDVHCVSAR